MVEVDYDDIGYEDDEPSLDFSEIIEKTVLTDDALARLCKVTKMTPSKLRAVMKILINVAMTGGEMVLTKYMNEHLDGDMKKAMEGLQPKLFTSILQFVTDDSTYIPPDEGDDDLFSDAEKSRRRAERDAYDDEYEYEDEDESEPQKAPEPQRPLTREEAEQARLSALIRGEMMAREAAINDPGTASWETEKMIYNDMQNAERFGTDPSQIVPMDSYQPRPPQGVVEYHEDGTETLYDPAGNAIDYDPNRAHQMIMENQRKEARRRQGFVERDEPEVIEPMDGGYPESGQYQRPEDIVPMDDVGYDDDSDDYDDGDYTEEVEDVVEVVEEEMDPEDFLSM